VTTVSLLPWPQTAPTWLEPWVIWRFKNRPDPKPAVPSTIPKWAWNYLQWVAWKRAGSPDGQRPAGAPLPIPSGTWPWVILKHVNIAVPVNPPPPPPPPSPPLLPIPANSWTLPLPIAWTAWAWTADSAWRDTDEGLRKPVDAGVRTVALQGGQADATVADRCRAYGLHVAMWGVADSRDEQWLNQLKAEAYIPQIEGLYQYQSAIGNLRAGVGVGLSISTVTTLDGLGGYIFRSDGSQTRVGTEALIAAGCTHAFTECYGEVGPVYGDVARMMDSTTRLNGFYHANPLIGTYWDWTPSMYNLSAYGRQFGFYLAETNNAQTWAELRVA